IFIDKLDGRTTNRHLYRALYIDDAQNRSPLSLATSPVHIHDVNPPERSLFLEALGGNKTITLRWRANTELDLAYYLLYRTDSLDAAQQPSTMLLHKQIEKHPTAPLMQFVDTVTPRITFYYRLVAVDISGNRSEPSELVAGQGYPEPPQPPTLSPPVWDAGHRKVTLTWTASDPALASLVERRQRSGPMWTTPIWVAATSWLPRGIYLHVDEPPDPGVTWEYRIKVRDVFDQVIETPGTQTTP
ncbi:MAG TPA: hypothetical protein VFY60_04695, partial [Pyrinomonadaceae bacterium]|nr:hypothetical protein [Pyrinomonadaceae bacterium]